MKSQKSAQEVFDAMTPTARRRQAWREAGASEHEIARRETVALDQTSTQRRDECFAAIDAMSAEIAVMSGTAACYQAERDEARAALERARDTLTATLAERDRLRAALQEIVDRAPGITGTVWRGELPASGIRRLADIARRALDQA